MNGGGREGASGVVRRDPAAEPVALSRSARNRHRSSDENVPTSSLRATIFPGIVGRGAFPGSPTVLDQYSVHLGPL